MFKLNFKQKNGKYVAAYKPQSKGTLMVNQSKGGDLFIFAYVDEVEPILIDKDITRKTDYLKEMDLTSVNILIESTTPVENACFSGEGEELSIADENSGEIFVAKIRATEEGYFITNLGFINFGDIIYYGQVGDNSTYMEMILHALSEESYNKISDTITLHIGEYVEEYPKYVFFPEVPEDGIEGLEFLQSFYADGKHMFDYYPFMEILESNRDCYMEFDYNGRHIVYDSSNVKQYIG